MSSTVGEGTPLTAQGEADGSGTASYVLPLQGTFNVESVVAQVSNAGADVKPVLKVLDKSGAVIAAIPASELLHTGDDGLLTWAWRLAGDGSSSSSFAPLEEIVNGAQITPVLGNFATFSFSHGSGSNLLDLTTPTQPKIVTAGLYALTFPVICNPAPVPPGQDARTYIGAPVVLTGFNDWTVQGGALQGPGSHVLSFLGFLPAGQRLDVTVANDSLAPARNFVCSLARVVRLA